MSIGRFGLAVIVISALHGTQRSQAEDDVLRTGTVRINFIANEGIILLQGEYGILIDALFRESVEPYAKIPDAQLEHMETANKPFEFVRAILVTHKHADHFSAASVARFMQNNLSAKLFTSQQVIDEVKAGSEGLDDRFIVADVADGKMASLDSDGVKIEAIRLSHGEGMEAVVNLGYILHFDGKRLLHTGDAELTEGNMKLLAKHAVGVDAACLPYWWLLSEKGRLFVDDTLKPASVLAVHVPPGEADEIERDIRVYMPEVLVMKKSWVSKRL